MRNFIVVAHLPLRAVESDSLGGATANAACMAVDNRTRDKMHGYVFPDASSVEGSVGHVVEFKPSLKLATHPPCHHYHSPFRPNPSDHEEQSLGVARFLPTPHDSSREYIAPFTSDCCMTCNAGTSGLSHHRPSRGTEYEHIDSSSSSSLESIASLGRTRQTQTTFIDWNADDDIYGIQCAVAGEAENVSLIGLMPPALGNVPLSIEQKRSLRETHNCIVLEAPSSHLSGFRKYCYRILEPIFHSMLPDYHLANHNCSDWSSYVRLNEAIAEAVVQEYQDGDLIWIHDYQLILTPHMIRSALKNARIGFVLTVPFPTSEIFRCLPSRAQILEGMLASDLIGFQAYSFAHHFLHSCTRLLGLEPSGGGIFQVEGERFTHITISPMGINPGLVREQLMATEALGKLGGLRGHSEGRKIIVGCDRCDVIGGIKQKLLAFEDLLSEYPQWRGQVTLIQVAKQGASITDGGKKEKNALLPREKTFEALSSHAAEINRRFGSLHYTPVILSTDASVQHLYALLQTADVFVSGSLRDGMSLMAHRYVLAQAVSGKCSPLLISEFSGSAQSLEGAIHINPWDSLDFCDALNEALDMSERDRRWRHARLLHRVQTSDAKSCSSFFLKELLRVTEERLQRQLNVVPSLDEFRLKSAFRLSQKQLCILDYDALLPSFRHIPQSLASITALRASLQHLSTSANCTIILISGRTAEQLEHTLGDVPALICAEDGFSCRDEKKAWSDLLPVPDFWDKLSSILEYWTERTPGSWVESKRASFIWHYSTAGDFGARQAKECHAHIQDAIGPNYPVQVADTGGEKLSIKLRGLNQRAALNAMLKRYLNSSYDFIVAFLRPKEGCVGPSDDLFKFATECLARVPCENAPRRAEYIVSVGRISTMVAPWHIADAQSVIRLLNYL